MKASFLLILAIVVAGHGESLSERKGRRFKECGKPYVHESANNARSAFPKQPWLVGIYRPVGLAPDVLVCEGVLINERYVLTAAACVNGTRNSLFRLVLGDFDVEGYMSEDHTIRRKIVHEDSEKTNAKDFLNDIALLELDKPVRFDKHIMPICLPPRNINSGGESTVVMGWNGSVAEQSVDVEVENNELCNAWFAAEYQGRKIPETMLCARPILGGVQPCRDGAALLASKNGRVQIVGVASGISSDACWYRNPYSILVSVYTNVTNYVDWIESNVKNASMPEVGENERNAEEESLARLRENINAASYAVAIGVVILIALLIVFALTALRLLYVYNLARQLKRQIIAITSDRPKAIVLNDSM